MNAIRIIGIGSPFGADCIAWDAVDALEQSGTLIRFPRRVVETFRCGSPGTGLLPLLTGVQAAILIDAIITGAPPGTVHRIDPDELYLEARQISSHDLGVAETLALARTLGLLPEKLVIYGIETGKKGEETEGMAVLISAIADEIDSYLLIAGLSTEDEER
ncbi:MAG TPA: hydrogenase maturation protease [Noviherbaspirillum sp.]|uniref:hydrogenase maturation protease n=1 Tax=Noviherbaspirillum sp. TaxID=1926288 RepID=UPI002B49DF60|nr:hydrogenase maturation protease [Noviherbaspirillum sp.]HJV88573.1 hydrogenase maturation protease [Noviherbaspirillum sp.]